MSSLSRTEEKPPLDRPDIYVLARFLDRLARPGSKWTRSSLQPAVRLNYGLYTKYLVFLEQKGWIRLEETERSPAVLLTDAGREAHDGLLNWLRRVFGSREW